MQKALTHFTSPAEIEAGGLSFLSPQPLYVGAPLQKRHVCLPEDSHRSGGAKCLTGPKLTGENLTCDESTSLS